MENNYGLNQGRSPSQGERYLPPIKRTSMSITTPAIAPSALSQSTAVSQPELNSTNRTFRLAEIPLSVDEGLLESYLNSLPHGNNELDKTDNVLSLSLAPYRDYWLVATVTFRREPDLFAQCQPKQSMTLNFPSELGSAKIHVDCDFMGITPLYCHEDAEVDIFAVHGLSSHPFGSWRSHTSPDVMWLRDLLPQDVKLSRIFIWGYDSNLRDGIATHSIEDFATTLLKHVQLARNYIEGFSSRPIIFVAHGIGGIIVKQALVDAALGNSEHSRMILQSCIGLLFFGVPNRGLDSARLEDLVKHQKNAPFVADLNEESQFLKSLHRNLARIWDKSLKSCIMVSFYETIDTNTIEVKDGEWSRTGKPARLVRRYSAIEAVFREEHHRQIPIFTDHYDMVKYNAKSDETYGRVLGELRDVLKEKVQ